jgi:hypothetical protein
MRGNLIMLVFRKDELVHIHCKDAACLNEWKTEARIGVMSSTLKAS